MNKTPVLTARLIIILMLVVSSLFAGNIYVAPGGSDTSPYDTWAKSAHDIQAALSNAVSDDTVWVSNGVYVGSMGIAQSWTNVAIIPTGVALRSANGPSVTTINGQNLRRGVCLTGSNTVLDGFTVTACSAPGQAGGGIYCSEYALATNCVVVSNTAEYGGGVYMEAGILVDSTIETNVSTYGGGGVYCWENGDNYGGRVDGCRITANTGNGGGGIFGRFAEINNCVISENRTPGGSYDGGGVYIYYEESYIRNSLIISNYTGRNGGGIYGLYDCEIQNCTIIDNACGQYGGGTAFRDGGILDNSIIYNNTSIGSHSNTYWFGSTNPVYTHCCMSPLTNGTANIDQDPRVDRVSGQLPASSPCIDAGTNAAWMVSAVDMDGHPRIFNERVDIGADETFVGSVSISGNNPVWSYWRVPVDAKCQWQTANSPAGTWSDFGNPVTSAISVIGIGYSSTPDEKYFRIIWEK